ncbi:MAG: DNA polymerase III subunit gamma/tau [Pseudomonadota bacterium]
MQHYLALARKWRPQQFADYVGQEHVVRAVSHALESGRLHHAFLFTGTRGVGKTTVARLLAKCLNCEQGVSSTPCGVCSACMEIEEGRFVDLIEVDAASRTKVDDTRELLENVQYAPTVGRYKVYLIDEVHMLSSHSFNALLKTLEEPPPHVKFLLATTDPQKLPVTVLSRCLHFSLRRLDPALIRERMAHILQAEQVPFDAAALALLARAADGSLRDALSLLDQAIVHGGGEVRREAVVDMLGQADRGMIFDLLDALAARDPQPLFAALDQLINLGRDPVALLDELLQALHAAAMRQVVRHGAGDDPLEAERLDRLAAAVAPADLQLYYQIALLARRDLHLSPDARLGLEMAFLRMLAFHPHGDDSAPAAAGAVPVREPGAAAYPRSNGAAREPSPAAQRQAPSPAPTPAGQGVSAPARGAQGDAGQPAADATPRAPAAAAGELDWARVIQSLNLSPLWRAVLDHSVAQEFTSEAVTIALAPSHSAMLEGGKFKPAMERALKEYFGVLPRLRFTRLGSGSAPAATPAQQQAAERERRQQAAEAAVRQDPTVQAILETFGGDLVKVEPKE